MNTMLGDFGYFEGWYFKQQSEESSIALIPAVHRERGQIKKASLQIITNEESFVIDYPFTAVDFQTNPLSVRLGKSFFSNNGITVNVESKECQLKGQLKFSQMIAPKKDIMGPFAKVPFMQCRHSLFSMKHKVTGILELNHKKIDFSQGLGYIEGDRGRSFPKEYLWTQCFFSQNEATNGSVMLAVADIPMPWGSFTGTIGFLLWKGKEYRFATYYGARIFSLTKNSVEIVQGVYKLRVELIESKHHDLNAPVVGGMNRQIKESICCRANYKFFEGERLLLDVTSDKASFEFEY